MKLNKRILSLILVIVMVLGMVPVASATDEAAVTCTECGSVGGHTLGCSQFVIPTCEECHGDLIGEKAGHSTACSQYKAPETTPAPASEEGTEGTTGDTTDTTGDTTEGATEGTTAPSTGATTAPSTGATTAPSTEPVVPEKTFAETLLEIDNLSDLLIAICDENNLDAVLALTAEEITALRARANELYAAIENPTEQDGWDLDDFLSTMDIVAGVEEELPEEPAFLATTANDTWQGQRFSSNSTQELGNGAVVTLRKLTDSDLENRQRNANFVVPSGVTLTIKGYGSFARGAGNTHSLIYVEQGGKLVIEGTSSEQPIIIDGKNQIANTPLIYSDGVVVIKNAIIQNGKNRSTNADGVPNGSGGGIRIGATGSLSMENSVVTHNTASVNGGGIYSVGPVKISNSTISYNRAMSTETGTPRVDAGRGGGFYLHNATAVAVFEDVLITQNAAMYYGGGGQADHGASLEIKGNTVFSYNTAVLHGAGALHLTSDAKFTMNGGTMEHNFAQYCGGAIHSSYSCQLTMNSGSIINNTSNGRGGGIHINTGGAITLGPDITISGNKVYKRSMGTSANVDATGDTWSNVKYLGMDTDFGYGGGILMDSGTCTVAGATITDNYAEVGGGGIALTMLNMGEGGLDDYMVINFEMTSGTVSNNRTDGDGAGVYVMTNKAEENLKKTFPESVAPDKNGVEKNYQWALAQIDATNKHGFSGQQILEGIPYASVSGGTIRDNVAATNGGGLYLGEKTKFIISGTGNISSNKAVDGAGVYVAKGTAEINGGTMTNNEASRDGGALYVVGTPNTDTVTMTAGEVTGNSAAQNGGAVYVSGGSMVMSNGKINDNTAKNNGGALYITGGNFTMISGSMTNNEATGTNTTTTDTYKGYGGGAFVNGGNVVIGVENCDGIEVSDKHTTTHMDKAHPLVKDNTALLCGGGLAVMGDGDVTMYCGQIITNHNGNENRGRGLNIYMQKGTFDYHVGADVGAAEAPELVIVGGKLIDRHQQSTEDKTALIYHHCNDNPCTHEVMNATATTNSYINLPDGEFYWEADEGYKFFGWTFYGPNTEGASANVRAKEDYKAMGLPIEVVGSADGVADNQINMYALWAPINNTITHKGIIVEDDGSVTEIDDYADATNPVSYTLKETASTIDLSDPVKPGYEFHGWYVFQNSGQNANWTHVDNEDVISYEPDHKVAGDGDSISNLDFSVDSTMQFIPAGQDLTVAAMTFGNITLVAKFVELDATINYVVVGPTGCGTVDRDQEVVPMATGTADGSVAAISNVNYRFVGWYAEESCETQLSTAAEYVPSRNAETNLWESATYYAKFEWNLTTMKITKTVSGDIYDADDTFRFVVKDKTGAAIANVTLKHGQSVVIKDVIVGDTYTVEELASSNRYTVDSATKSVPIAPPTVENKVSFVNTANEKKWFSATDVVKNTFGNGSLIEKIFGN